MMDSVFTPCSGNRQTKGPYPFSIDTTSERFSASDQFSQNPYDTPPPSSTYSRGEHGLPIDASTGAHSPELYNLSVHLNYIGEDYASHQPSVNHFRAYGNVDALSSHGSNIKHEPNLVPAFRPVEFDHAVHVPTYGSPHHGSIYADYCGGSPCSEFGLAPAEQKWQMAATFNHPRPIETLALAEPLFSQSTTTSFDPSVSMLTPSFSSSASSAMSFGGFDFEPPHLVSIVPSQTFADDTAMQTSSPMSYKGEEDFTFLPKWKRESPEEESKSVLVKMSSPELKPIPVRLSGRATRVSGRRNGRSSNSSRRRPLKQEPAETRFDTFGTEIEFEEDVDWARYSRDRNGRMVLRKGGQDRHLFTCDRLDLNCRSSFKRAEHLHRHEKTHLNKREHPCPFAGIVKCDKIDGKAVGRTDNHRDHMATHIKNWLKQSRGEVKCRGRSGPVSLETAQKIICARWDAVDADKMLKSLQKNFRKLGPQYNFHEDELTFPMFLD